MAALDSILPMLAFVVSSSASMSFRLYNSHYGYKWPTLESATDDVDSLERGDVEMESLDESILKNKSGIMRTDSEYSLGLNQNEIYVQDQIMQYGLCDTGLYAIWVLRVASCCSVSVIIAYGIHKAFIHRKMH